MYCREKDRQGGVRERERETSQLFTDTTTHNDLEAMRVDRKAAIYRFQVSRHTQSCRVLMVDCGKPSKGRQ